MDRIALYMRDLFVHMHGQVDELRAACWSERTIAAQQALTNEKPAVIADISKLIVYLTRLREEVAGLEMVDIEVPNE